MAADFEYLDALPVDTERKIKLGANMRWWAPLSLLKTLNPGETPWFIWLLEF
jgi:hypothetical protein